MGRLWSKRPQTFCCFNEENEYAEPVENDPALYRYRADGTDGHDAG